MSGLEAADGSESAYFSRTPKQHYHVCRKDRLYGFVGVCNDIQTGACFKYYEKNENERWTVTLMHELGSKWSTFLTHYIGEAFVAAGVQPKIRTSDRAVIFTF